MASAKTTVRSNAPTNLWTDSAPAVTFGREQFRFSVSRKVRKLDALDIDPWVETSSWQRSGAFRTGELTFRRPLGLHTSAMIASGDEVRCEWRPGPAGSFRTLWQMKVATPNHQIKEGVMSIALSSALDPMMRSKVAWNFHKGKSKPTGWDAAEVTRAVCKRFGVKIGALPKATYKSARLVEKSMSGYDMLTKVWTRERHHTGRRYDIDISRGTVEIREVREPQYMLLLGAAIADATLNQSLSGIASAVVATATHKKKGSKKATKLRVRVVDAGRRARYGYIVKTLHAPASIDSLAELRRWAKERLTQTFQSKQTVTFTHPGIPLVDRGDALRLYLPEADFHQVVFVTDVRHDLSAGSYTMAITVGFDDPWAADLKAGKVTQAKDKVAVARARKVSRTRGEHAAVAAVGLLAGRAASRASK